MEWVGSAVSLRSKLATCGRSAPAWRYNASEKLAPPFFLSSIFRTAGLLSVLRSPCIESEMPFCNTSKPAGGASSAAGNGIKIFYRTYGHGKSKVLLIIGLAGTHDSWGPQIKGLTGTDVPNEDDNPDGPDYENGDGIEVCAFDNRGMGRSSVPTKKSEYTTLVMAKDALALMDHLGWKKAHVFGHSMGAMIACKLAAIAPDRILSLALLNVTGGGFQCFPKKLLDKWKDMKTQVHDLSTFPHLQCAAPCMGPEIRGNNILTCGTMEVAFGKTKPHKLR